MPDSSESAKNTVLVVDDSPDGLQILNEVLKRDYDVRLARGGEQALQAAMQKPQPDAILLDIMMPGIDGVEVLQQLRLRWPEIPVVMLTAVSDVAIAKSALRRGAFDYVPKPFEWEHLERVVAAALTVKTIA
jgi:putative two-component system response regulator